MPPAEAKSLEARLLVAIEQGRLKWVRGRLRDGVDVNFRHEIYGGSIGVTALKVAIDRRRADIVQLLLENGADPNQVPHFLPPLLLAAQVGSNRICEILLAAGADPDAVSASGERAVDLCTGDRPAAQRLRALLTSASARKRMRRIASAT